MPTRNRRTDCNPNGKHGMQRTMKNRAATRARFSRWLISNLNRLGVDEGSSGQPHRHRTVWLAEHGFNAETVRLWLKGESVPRLHTLPALATAFGVSLGEVCTAAGRPPSDSVRLRYLSDRDNTLAVVLHQWRTKNKLTWEQAGERIGVSGSNLCRLGAGHHAEPSLSVVVAIADGMEVSPAFIAQACRSTADVAEPLDVLAAAASTELAMTLRRARKDAGLSIDELSARSGTSSDLILITEMGRHVPTEVPLLQLAQSLHLGLSELLLISGRAGDEISARRVARELETAFRITPPADFADTLREARTQAKTTTIRLAEQLGVDRFMISRWQNGHTSPCSAAKVVALADALGKPAAPLLAAWVARAA